jgi:hypothetical protein
MSNPCVGAQGHRLEADQAQTSMPTDQSGLPSLAAPATTAANTARRLREPATKASQCQARGQARNHRWSS